MQTILIDATAPLRLERTLPLPVGIGWRARSSARDPAGSFVDHLDAEIQFDGSSYQAVISKPAGAMMVWPRPAGRLGGSYFFDYEIYDPDGDTVMSSDTVNVLVHFPIPRLVTDSDEDRFMRRSADDYAAAWEKLLPPGTAWSRDPGSDLMRLGAGISEIWGNRVDPRGADLLETEADPRATLELLAEWERAFGLPDECVAEPLTIPDRRAALLARMTTEGGQSPAYFIALAGQLGYDIKIREYSPFMCGMSRCGDTRPTGAATEQYRWMIGEPEMRFTWVVELRGRRLSWFRAGSGQCGVDPMLRIGQATDLECLIRRYKPAQTNVVFDYSHAA